MYAGRAVTAWPPNGTSLATVTLADVATPLTVTLALTNHAGHRTPQLYVRGDRHCAVHRYGAVLLRQLPGDAPHLTNLTASCMRAGQMVFHGVRYALVVDATLRYMYGAVVLRMLCCIV